MSIKKVWIEEGCTACEACVDICPDVFETASFLKLELSLNKHMINQLMFK